MIKLLPTKSNVHLHVYGEEYTGYEVNKQFRPCSTSSPVQSCKSHVSRPSSCAILAAFHGEAY